MSEREYTWTAAGKASLAASGLELHEALEALTSPIRADLPLVGGPLWLVTGMTDDGKVIQAIVAQQYGTTRYAVTAIGVIVGDALAAFHAEIKKQTEEDS